MGAASPADGEARRARRALAVAVAIAVAVRGAYFLCYLRSPLFGSYGIDRLYYRAWALRIAGGDWLGRGPFEQGPLYAYLLGGAYRLLGGEDALVLPLQLLLGIATVLLVRSCARRAWGEPGGTAAAIAAAVYGPYVYHECMTMKSFLEPHLVTASLAAALRGGAVGRARWHALAGGAVGAACLVREAHVLLLAPLLWHAARPTTGTGASPPPSLPRRAAAPAALLLAFLLALLPTAARNLAVSGEFVASTSGGGELFYLSWGPQNTTGFYSAPDFVRGVPFLEHHDFREEAFFRTRTPMSRRDFSHFWYRESMAAVVREPARAAELLLRKGITLLQDEEIPDGEDYRVTGEWIPLLRVLPSFGWIAGAGLLGLLLSRRRGREARLAALFALVLAGEVLATYHFARFRLAFAAAWIVLAGGGFAWLLDAARRRDRAGRRRLALAAAALSLATLLSFLPPLGGDSFLPEQRAAYRRLVPSMADRRRQALRLLAADRRGEGGAHGPLDLGLAFEDAGLYPEAVETFREAAREGHDEGEARRELAELLERMGEFDEAAREAEALVLEHPGDGRGRLLLGTALSSLGAVTEDPAASAAILARAEEQLRGAAALLPGRAEAQRRLGRVLHFRGDDRGALAALDRALALSPEDGDAARERRWIVEEAARGGAGR